MAPFLVLTIDLSYTKMPSHIFKKLFLENNPEEILRLIETISVPPLQQQYVFMGYCPGALLENRQDDIWIADGFLWYVGDE